MPKTSNATYLENMYDPEVLAQMVHAKLPSDIVVTPFAKIDNTLEGKPGSTITVPQYRYIGDAEDVAEGALCPTNKLTTTHAEYKVKKIKKGAEITDEAAQSGYGDPENALVVQLSKSIASKIDKDCIETLYEATTKHNETESIISYDGIVNAIDKFDEEVQQEKVMFINPHQASQLRKDDDFISRDKYGHDTAVVMTGEIGMIAGAHIVASRKVAASEGQKGIAGIYAATFNGTPEADDTFVMDGVTLYTAKGGEKTEELLKLIADAITGAEEFNKIFSVSVEPETSAVVLTQIVPGKGAAPKFEAKSATCLVSGEIRQEGRAELPAGFICPIVQLTADPESQLELPAMTIYMKKGLKIEPKRNADYDTTEYYASQHYVCALTDATKVVLACFATGDDDKRKAKAKKN